MTIFYEFKDPFGSIYIISEGDWKDLGRPRTYQEYEKAFTKRKEREENILQKVSSE